MKLNINNGIKYLTFESFEKYGIKHCFSTRVCGASDNFSFSASGGSTLDTMRENIRKISEAVGFDAKNIVASKQTHTVNIKTVMQKDRGKGYLRPSDYSDIDGLVTNTGGIVLMTFYADCVPLYFYDPVNNAAALAHSGWKGTLGEIGRLTVERMGKEFLTDPGRLICGIGPCIHGCCFEVEEDVAQMFMKKRFFEESDIKQISDEKYLLDLTKMNKRMLEYAGINPANIEADEHCTKCENELFFSYRRDGAGMGSLAAFLELR